MCLARNSCALRCLYVKPISRELCTIYARYSPSCYIHSKFRMKLTVARTSRVAHFAVQPLPQTQHTSTFITTSACRMYRMKAYYYKVIDFKSESLVIIDSCCSRIKEPNSYSITTPSRAITPTNHTFKNNNSYLPHLKEQ